MCASKTLSLPKRPGSIILINPTKFLGNLLLAGGLMQRYVLWCQEQGISLTLVLDARYRELAAASWPHLSIIYYPRSELDLRRPLPALRHWWRCLRKIRACRADLAFSLEEDALAHQLTRLSGARYRVGSSRERSTLGLHAMLPIRRARALGEERHIWFSYHAVLVALGMPRQGSPHYMRLPLLQLSASLRQRLAILGVDFARPLAIVHAGATKPYKCWPLPHYRGLIGALELRGLQVLLTGIGSADRAGNQQLAAGNGAIDLSDELSLMALIALLREARLVVGNDSGPAHLAAAVRVPGVTLFGPTDVTLWQPIGEQTTTLHARHLCDPACRRRNCLRDYACLESITPAQVIDVLTQRQLLPAAIDHSS